MRKLAAIMFTDIEGFTRLMRHNENEAIELLERYKKIHTQYVKQFKGQTVKYLGDGTLTIFSSAIQAVKCSIALQQALQTKPSIPVRIGIHQGDIISENKDVIGDAVNLASRIQPCGIAGSILISEKVHDELENHSEIADMPLGNFNLKNIPHSVNLFAIKAEGIKVPSSLNTVPQKKPEPVKPATQKNKSKKKLLKKRILPISLLVLLITAISVWFIKKTKGGSNTELLKTIAITPFDNINKDEKNNFLSEGLTEEIVALLSSNLELKIKKIPGSVINENNENLAKLANDIQAGSYLEGKVQHDGDSLYVFVNLCNTSNKQVIWSQKYREHYSHLMTVQQEVAAKIAAALKTNFNESKIKSFVQDRTTNPLAYNFYIQGRYALKQRTDKSMREAIALFKKAIKEDNNFALAYSGISDAYTLLVDNGYIPNDSGIDLARIAVEHAFLLDSSSAEIRASKAIFFSVMEGKHADALKELNLSLALSPNYADAHQWYALELIADRQFDSALLHIEQAMELEPFSERIWANKGLILMFARNYQKAIDILNYAIGHFTENIQLFRNYKTDCHYWLGEKDSVLYYAKFNDGYLNKYSFWEAVYSHDNTKLKKLLEEQKLAEGKVDNETNAVYYVFMNQNKKTLEYIKAAFDNKEFSWLLYLNVSPTWDALHKEQLFQDIVSKLGLTN